MEGEIVIKRWEDLDGEVKCRVIDYVVSYRHFYILIYNIISNPPKADLTKKSSPDYPVTILESRKFINLQNLDRFIRREFTGQMPKA